jgi:hypothetical protein
MSRTLKSALTLFALAALVGAGGLWGWGSFTQPLPDRSPPPICVDTPVRAGSKVVPGQVVVSVYNASSRAGLASRTSDLLTGRGFGTGELGNAPDGTQVKVAEVWAEDKRNPAAKLVRSYLGKKARIRETTPLGPGVTVVVGESFKELSKGKAAVTVAEDARICSPPAG